MAIGVVQAKSTQKWYFLASKPIFKKCPRLLLSLNPSYAKKNRVKMVHKQVFTGADFKSPPYSMSIPWNPDPETVYNIIEFKSFSDLISIDFEVGTSQY